ncbi:DUF551 domain-containing protein [Enterobacter hormaechei]|uniref:DUF551 domain-containing protein n=1 Tax=Enterobacter hormaechei TaxID=158836 RepID=UPI00403ACAC2
MSTITKELAKLFRKITNSEIDSEGNAHAVLSPADSTLINRARIALASLEAEDVAWLLSGGGAKNNVSFDSGNAYADPLREVTPLYTAPPAPVSVPAAMEMDDDFDSAFEHGKAVGWNACRAAMLQGADGTLNNECTIPATQFKPVADLYGLTSPTGGETSFTFDAVEARDFIDGGWSCQEYVELGRFQEAMLQNGNSPAQSDCCPAQNCIAPALGGNSPVIADGWVACSERMPEFGTEIFYFCQDDGLRDCGIVSSSNFSGKGDAELYVHAEGYDLRFGVDISHWMPLPASPQQK